jgi:hypothetical protein
MVRLLSKLIETLVRTLILMIPLSPTTLIAHVSELEALFIKKRGTMYAIKVKALAIYFRLLDTCSMRISNR